MILGTMVFVLAVLVGWVYWQQTRLSNTLQSIAYVIGDLVHNQSVPPQTAPEIILEGDVTDVEVKHEEVVAAVADDRVDVEIESEPSVETPLAEKPLDTDGLESKTRKELMELLTTRGIPFGKNDTKNTLVSLLKATA